jgi:N,N'-diacetyllegionaminate synthase
MRIPEMTKSPDPNGRRVERCLVIGEVAQAHDGSLAQAHAFIDAIAAAGADAVKFQTHIAAAESTPAEPWRSRFTDQDATRYDYWRRMEFAEHHWRGLRDHAARRQLQFLSSPFSIEAVELLERVGVSAWKIASGEVSNGPLLDRVARTGLPVYLSSGMSTFEELDAAVARVRRHGAPVAVMQCTSAYPCAPEQIGLNLIPELRVRYGAAVGLSDHSGTIYPGLAGAALGLDLLEVHVTLSAHMFSPDQAASLTPESLRTLVDGVRFIERMRAHPVDKDAASRALAPLRQIFTKSLVASRALEAGTVLCESDLRLKKPGTGLSAAHLPTLLGRRLRHDVPADQLLAESDLEAIAVAEESSF